MGKRKISLQIRFWYISSEGKDKPAQSHQSLHCSLTQIVEEDEDSCQHPDFFLHWIDQHGCLKYDFDRAVEMLCPTCPTWSHFIHDKFHSGLFTCI